MKTIDQFRLIRILGNGSFGVVYYGENMRNNSEIAAKQINIEGMTCEAISSVGREIECMAQVRSNHIVSLIEVIRSSTNLYLIMELCEGGDLKRYLGQKGKLSEDLARKWIKQIIKALLELKNREIMHRDLKLANILLTEANENGDIKLADFGLARQLGTDGYAWTRLGTPLFMAPEIFDNQRYNYKADVWSLGVLSYELLIGTRPFISKNISGLREAQRRGVEFNPFDGISDEAKDFIRAMLTYNQEHRPNYEDLMEMPFITGNREYIQSAPEAIPASQDIRTMDQLSQTNFIIIRNDGDFAEEVLSLQEELFEKRYFHAALCLSTHCSLIFSRLIDSLEQSVSHESHTALINSLMERLIHNYDRAYSMSNCIKDELGVINLEFQSEAFVRSLTNQLFQIVKVMIQTHGLTRINKFLIDIVVYYDNSNTEARHIQQDPSFLTQ